VKKPRLTIKCEKHGEQLALPRIDNRLLRQDEWPENVESLPRLCTHCIAEAMINPIRKSETHEVLVLSVKPEDLTP